MVFFLLTHFVAFCCGVYFYDAPWVKSGKAKLRSFTKKVTK